MVKENRKQKLIKTIKFLAAYLVAAWTFLQFLDWILLRNGISPNWVDLFLWFFIGIVPSVLIYFFNQDRINEGILKLREKILIPLNVIVLCLVLYFGFGNTDLGATTQEISYTDEQGTQQSQFITKEEFRIGIPIYGFENLSNNDSLNWMRYGIGRILEEDLFQNKSISPDFSFYTDTSTKIEEASLFNDFYIDGDFTKEGENFIVNTYKRKSNNGKILAQQTFKGDDLLSLIDDITVFVIENSGFTETKQLRYLDYPVNEFMSDSLNAIKEYINGNYSKAVSIDKKFALAYLAYAKKSLRVSRGKLEVQDLADKAFENRNRLPLQKQLEVHIQRNLAYENFDDAIEQVKLQLEVDPHNSFYNGVLFSIYGETQQTKRYMESSNKLFEIDQNPDTGTNLAIATMTNGDDELLIEAIKNYEIISPSLKIFKIQPLLYKQDLKKVSALIKDIKSLYPYYKKRISVYDSSLAYIENNGYDISKFKKFEGNYRSGFNEQSHTLWTANNRIIQYVKNQRMYPLLPAGKNTLVTGFVNNETYKYDLVLDNDGKPIGYNMKILYFNNEDNFWFWKEDESIKKAHEAYDNGDYKNALELYQIAIEANPKHAYIENIISNLKYTDSIGKEGVIRQNETFAGNYGPRKFWIEDDKFYYKRKDDKTELAKVELLPISENRYIDLTRLGIIMAFEKDPSGKLASVGYSFLTDDLQFKWETIPGETGNYFLKED